MRFSRMAKTRQITPRAHQGAHAALLRVLAADSNDVYHRVVKFVAVPALVAYATHALLTPGECSPTRSVSGDSGLTMDLKAALPPWLLAIHSFSALALVFLTLAQKENVARGLLPSLIPSASQAGRPVKLVYSQSLKRHRRIGYTCLAACTAMDVRPSRMRWL